MTELSVGVAGFEPATSSSQTRRDNRATLHPDPDLFKNDFLNGSANIDVFLIKKHSD